MADMPAPPVQPPPWSDLDADLLAQVVVLCTLKDYASCRTVCRSWCSALPLPLPQPLAVLPADGNAGLPVSLAVCFLYMQRWFRHPGLGLHQPTRISAADCRCVGARDGWVALVAGNDAQTACGPVLFNPFTGEEIALHKSLYDTTHNLAPKIVFSPNPTPRDFAAVSVCQPKRLALQRAYGSGGGSFTTIEDTDAFMDGAILVDVAYGEDGRVYCLATDGQVYVLHFNRHLRGRRWLSAVEVRPLLSSHLGTDAFPPPYDAISRLTDVKNLVLCDGVMYQIWRRPSGAGNATIDASPSIGGGCWKPGRVYEGDVFVLRYDPTSRPPWTVAERKDLGGRAVFIGMNDAAVVRGDGVRPNSVYYWESLGEGDYKAMVYSMATGSSVRWPAATGGLSSPVWYFKPVVQRQSVEATEIAEKEATCPEYHDDEDLEPIYDKFRGRPSRIGFEG